MACKSRGWHICLGSCLGTCCWGLSSTCSSSCCSSFVRGSCSGCVACCGCDSSGVGPADNCSPRCITAPATGHISSTPCVGSLERHAPLKRVAERLMELVAPVDPQSELIMPPALGFHALLCL